MLSTQLIYVLAHALTAAIVAILGYRAVAGTNMRGRRWFGAFMLSLTAWSTLAAIGVLVPDVRVLFAIYLSIATLAMVAALLLVVFTLAYLGRPIRDNRLLQLFVGAFLALLPVVLTAPWHDFYYASVEFLETPFPHLHFTPGPGFGLVVTFVVLAVTVVVITLIRVAIYSRHRPSRAVFVLAIGLALSFVPLTLSQLDILLLETYDHSAFGLAIDAVAIWYAAFRLGLIDIAPVARDEVIDDITDPYIALDANRRVADYNPASESLFATGDSESIDDKLIGEPIATVMPDLADEIPATSAEIRERETDVTLDRIGERRQFHASVEPLYDHHDIVRGWVIILRDITELKARERELQRQNDRLDRFASIISHDLQNPLTVANLHVERARAEEDLEPLGDALAAHDRMKRMIDELLTLAKADATVEETEPVVLADLVGNTWDVVHRDGATLEVDLADDYRLDADPDLLRHVLENLIGNAIKHNDDDEITVRAGPLGDGNAGFFVEDTGEGIPEPERSQVFDLGYSTAAGGTGFGLSIVGEFVEAHDWEIVVTEGEHGGARFEIYTGKR